MPVIPIDTDQIVITASRSTEQAEKTPASISLIDATTIQRLGEPQIVSLLRLTPSVAVSSSGPAGSFTEVRIRGAEANHSLLFMDGIKLNDPASGDIPRFELLNADLASRIEVVRGPQSALWGSDAIGGVISINGLDDPGGWAFSGEGGSFGSRRASASAGVRAGKLSFAAAGGWQSAQGIDSFGSPVGDRDGFHNLSGRARMTIDLDGWRVGAAGLAFSGKSEFDGYDLVTFAHQDTLDSSRNRLAAGRIWADFGSDNSTWAGGLSATLLGSSNRNRLADDPINRTSGGRRSLSGQIERRFVSGPLSHRLIIAAEDERETFHARDTLYGGFTDQDRSRSHQGLTAEWRGQYRGWNGGLALRRDMFNRFRDATSFRASLLAPLANGLKLAGNYSEGIAQPTFFDLYGFFPGNFVGNPSLRPERSKGFEVGLRWSRSKLAASATWFRQRLTGEIVDVFDPQTFLQTSENKDGASRRRGIEATFAWHPGEWLNLGTNYTYLDASEPDPSGLRLSEELRRPRHSGSIRADGQIGRFTYGASLAYVGRHRDRRDNFPYDLVILDSYWLAGAEVAYQIAPSIDLTLRGANLLDQKYQDSFGYRTEGRGIFAGIRLAGRRSSP